MLNKVMRFFFRRQVESSNLKWVAWHPLGGGTLAVEFQSGGMYAYSGVPLKTYKGLVAAHKNNESVGSTFHNHIKLGGYAYERLS